MTSSAEWTVKTAMTKMVPNGSSHLLGSCKAPTYTSDVEPDSLNTSTGQCTVAVIVRLHYPAETLARLFAKGIFHTNLARERNENIIRDACPAVCERDLSHEPGKREKREYYQRRLPGCLRKGSFTRTWQERETRILSETLARLFAKGIFHTNLARERKENNIRDACPAVC